MEIDVRSPQGNTLVALGIATRMMKAGSCGKGAIDALTAAVLGAGSCGEARAAITAATSGRVTFVGGENEA